MKDSEDVGKNGSIM